MNSRNMHSMFKNVLDESCHFKINISLICLILLSIIIFHKPLSDHIKQTHLYTENNAKSRILSYQTPNFQALAQMLYTQQPLRADSINNRLAGLFFLTFYQKAMSLYPDDFEMHYCLGVNQLIHGDINEAKSSFIQSLKINPSFIYSYYNLAIILLKENNPDAAKKLLMVALSLDPKLTLNAIIEKQAFNIIWRHMPNYQEYLIMQLKKTLLHIDHLLNNPVISDDIQPILI